MASVSSPQKAGNNSDYDSEVAKGISPEPHSDQDSAQDNYPESQEETLPKSTSTSFTAQDESDGNIWYNSLCLSYFTFGAQLQKTRPMPDANFKGQCKKCNKTVSGRISSTTNWSNHLKKAHRELHIEYIKKKEQRRNLASSNPVSSKMVAGRLKRERIRQSKIEFQSAKQPTRLPAFLQKKIDIVIPCITKIKSAMINVIDIAPNGYGVNIRRGLMMHLSRRFDPILKRESFMLATALHPRFKLNWIPKEDEELNSEVRRLLEQNLEVFCPVTDLTTNVRAPIETDDPLHIPSRATPYMNELDLFMVDPDISLDSLHKYPRIKALFLRFNTALPSSAPVERLFSAGPLILTARRNRLSDEFFETLLILKIHKSL